MLFFSLTQPKTFFREWCSLFHICSCCWLTRKDQNNNIFANLSISSNFFYVECRQYWFMPFLFKSVIALPTKIILWITKREKGLWICYISQHGNSSWILNGCACTGNQQRFLGFSSPYIYCDIFPSYISDGLSNYLN